MNEIDDFSEVLLQFVPHFAELFYFYSCKKRPKAQPLNYPHTLFKNNLLIWFGEVHVECHKNIQIF